MTIEYDINKCLILHIIDNPEKIHQPWFITKFNAINTKA